MNDHKLYKKLAEVSAFGELMDTVNTRSKGLYFDTVLGQAKELDLIRSGNITSMVPAEYKDVYQEKFTRTVQKLTAMAELYIGDKWDDPIELAEWSGFHLGAGLVHTSLVQDHIPAQKTKLATVTLAYQTLLHSVTSTIGTLAK
jgi:hypothetical protein